MSTNVRELQEAFVKDYCNNDFEGASGDALPFGVQEAINKLTAKSNNNPTGISQKENPDGKSVTFTAENMPKDVKMLLQPYRKMRWF